MKPMKRIDWQDRKSLQAFLDDRSGAEADYLEDALPAIFHRLQAGVELPWQLQEIYDHINNDDQETFTMWMRAQLRARKQSQM